MQGKGTQRFLMGGNGRVSPLVVPSLLGLALLTASAVPAAQTLLPKPKENRPLPSASELAREPQARIPLTADTATVNPADSPYARRPRLTRVTSSPVSGAVTAANVAASAPSAVSLESLDSTATTPAITVVTDLTSQKSSPRLSASGSANAVPEPGTLALSAVALLPVVATLRRRALR